MNILREALSAIVRILMVALIACANSYGMNQISALPVSPEVLQALPQPAWDAIQNVAYKAGFEGAKEAMKPSTLSLCLTPFSYVAYAAGFTNMRAFLMNVAPTFVCAYLLTQVYYLRKELAAVDKKVRNNGNGIAKNERLLVSQGAKIDGMYDQWHTVYAAAKRINEELPSLKTELNNLKDQVTDLDGKMTKRLEELERKMTAFEANVMKLLREMQTNLAQMSKDIKTHVDTSNQKVMEHVDHSICAMEANISHQFNSFKTEMKEYMQESDRESKERLDASLNKLFAEMSNLKACVESKNQETQTIVKQEIKKFAEEAKINVSNIAKMVNKNHKELSDKVSEGIEHMQGIQILLKRLNVKVNSLEEAARLMGISLGSRKPFHYSSSVNGIFGKSIIFMDNSIQRKQPSLNNLSVPMSNDNNNVVTSYADVQALRQRIAGLSASNATKRSTTTRGGPLIHY